MLELKSKIEVVDARIICITPYVPQADDSLAETLQASTHPPLKPLVST